ncbi:hypothetical protein M419DRAFT_38703 [Trichoderma reesei RUT C-30]|uniref:Uncharacterized protein n=1 Tax=Hypocrea jecorina (strain ATCC 56765 / BCRC 32924 / NRRL 11460 / Rut C-30) TaxID=1344414 RepID=A0A024RZ97_HYPJR|nr:hypothetical protein M419DRAFT_38703 [Trichoderma reesei RUT C-30]
MKILAQTPGHLCLCIVVVVVVYSTRHCWLTSVIALDSHLPTYPEIPSYSPPSGDSTYYTFRLSPLFCPLPLLPPLPLPLSQSTSPLPLHPHVSAPLPEGVVTPQAVCVPVRYTRC